MAIVSSIIRAAMTASPVTAPLAQIWSEVESRWEQEKTLLFCKALEEMMKKHENEISERLKRQESEINETNNRIASLERIVDCLSKEYEKDKIQILAMITANCILNDSLTWEQKNKAIDSFREITIEDLEILKLIACKGTVQVEAISKDVESIIKPLCKLSSIGLIAETIPNSFSAQSVMKDWKNVWRCKYFVILSSGKELLSLIAE